uniref:Serine-threonine/tyrosine-protein kinase catalytic domain-containing protein n=1 Tax=Romanomermis culicivorax TaxID=13658 RepID=A0A915I4F3_ROMCU
MDNDKDNYSLMLRCWHHEPAIRPDFGRLVSILGETLQQRSFDPFAPFATVDFELYFTPVLFMDHHLHQITNALGSTSNNRTTNHHHPAQFVNGQSTFVR